jgi:hypothetical protein
VTQIHVLNSSIEPVIGSITGIIGELTDLDQTIGNYYAVLSDGASKIEQIDFLRIKKTPSEDRL